LFLPKPRVLVPLSSYHVPGAWPPFPSCEISDHFFFDDRLSPFQFHFDEERLFLCIPFRRRRDEDDSSNPYGPFTRKLLFSPVAPTVPSPFPHSTHGRGERIPSLSFNFPRVSLLHLHFDPQPCRIRATRALLPHFSLGDIFPGHNDLFPYSVV